ncbi:uncharacterized protein SEPMUDRAFT_111263 [Sphaerulina musiva SO2202]|uniref:Uncharacterized protein n=1 Tax=Sphaerulina musiva (strain SO2202) TaxID=692275 RepID=M3CA72_SPHMS|nr:uncharacterized protein SEPMUDRAFT_111263 [Sphaerulina musiva SO2202]EMF08760.1 hypothetical protein SEPMUDRAFT_111263 [Sphaerulina musiva SO2202]
MKFLAFTSAITIASLVGCCSALIAPQKRATSKALGEIYAYGTNISGSQVFVDNGIAYIGDSTAMDGAMNVTFVQTGTEISVHKHYRNGTDAGSDEYLAIDTTAGASNPVLIANSAAVADGYTTEGFNLYGMQITWLTSSRAMQSKFYVVETETTDVWELYWNADSATSDKGTDVILKAFGPPDLGTSEP